MRDVRNASDPFKPVSDDDRPRVSLDRVSLESAGALTGSVTELRRFGRRVFALDQASPVRSRARCASAESGAKSDNADHGSDDDAGK